MSPYKSLTIFSGCLLSLGVLSAQADTIEKTTTQTTTVESAPTTTVPAVVPLNTTQPVPAFVLPAQISYLVVDGKSGIILGSYDVATKLLEGGQSIPTGALIVEKNSGRLVATVDATGSIVDVYTTPVTQTLSTIIVERRSRIAQMINDARAAGTLSKEQAAAMKTELNRIAAESVLTSPQLTYGKAMLIGYNLDLLTDRLVPIVSTVQPLAPLVPAEFVVVGGRLSMVDKLTYRRIALERRIDDEYKAGRLSARNVSRLKDQLDQIASLENKYGNTSGQLSSSKQRRLAMQLDAVQSSIDSDVSSINRKRSNIGLIVD